MISIFFNLKRDNTISNSNCVFEIKWKCLLNLKNTTSVVTILNLLLTFGIVVYSEHGNLRISGDPNQPPKLYASSYSIFIPKTLKKSTISNM
jgi:hypothetical protein